MFSQSRPGPCVGHRRAGKRWSGRLRLATAIVVPMTTETIPAISERQEAAIRRLTIAAEAGEFDDTSQDAVDHLISQLPDGYVLDDENRVVRLDPSLPDHVYIPALIFGVPSDPVRIPVYR